MYGAIIGDIVGSRFEFDQGDKSREFEFFTPECDFTDDTVMTVAVAEALLDAGKDAGEETVKKNLIASMKKWGQKYPSAGYGARFISWVLTDDPKPYGSYGNGSGMRVSPAGWLYDSIDRTREVARWTSEITHNHPEGIKGAESTAAAIFMARNGAAKDEIRQYIIDEFGYDLSRTLDDIRPTYYVEDCMRTMPEAFTCFLEADSYEETIRNVMYIGGDTDTLGAIAGAIAEAFFGLPLKYIMDASDYLTDEMHEVINRFNDVVHPGTIQESYTGNDLIKKAASEAKANWNEGNLLNLLGVLRKRMYEEGEVPTYMYVANGVDMTHVMDPEKLLMGQKQEFQLEEDVRLRKSKMTDGGGLSWFPLFTDEDEMNRVHLSGITMNVPIQIILEDGLTSDEVEGITINPMTDDVRIPKEILKIVLRR